MILYNKRNTSSFRKHAVTAHKSICSHFVSYMDVRQNIMAGDDAPYLEGSVGIPLSPRKIPNDESFCTSTMAIFKKKTSCGPNHPHQMDHEGHLVMMMEHAYTPLLLVEGE